MKNPRLKKGAIRSIFPNCPSYLTTTKRKQKSPKKKTPLDESAVKKAKVEVDSNVKDRVLHDNSNISNPRKTTNSNVIPSEDEETADPKEPPDPENSNAIPNENKETAAPEKPDAGPEHSKTLEDTESAERSNPFNSLFISMDSIKMPISWYLRQCDERYRCIEITQSTSRLIKGEIKFSTSKQITVSSDMRIRAEVSGIALPLEKLGLTEMHISSVSELEALIKKFDNLKVCSGCASPNSVRNVENSIAVRDPSGYLRHLKCSLVNPIGTKSTSCKRCSEGKVLAERRYDCKR